MYIDDYNLHIKHITSRSKLFIIDVILESSVVLLNILMPTTCVCQLLILITVILIIVLLCYWSIINGHQLSV